MPNPATRHSRFGTTISVIHNPNKKAGDPQPVSSVLHRQQALNKEAVEIMDIKKRQRPRKGNTADELSREDNLSVGARKILQDLANEFLKACFNCEFHWRPIFSLLTPLTVRWWLFGG
jgi:replication fork protection complex subunit Tof1/Swi1